jgi:chromosome partitioning protein
LLTLNALIAADSVIIPVQCEYLALEGLGKILNTIKTVKAKMNPGLEIEGFLLTMYSRTNLANQVVAEVRKFFGKLVFETIIQRNIRLSEAPSHRLSAIKYDASSSGAIAYLNLAREFLNNNQ